MDKSPCRSLAFIEEKFFMENRIEKSCVIGKGLLKVFWDDNLLEALEDFKKISTFNMTWDKPFKKVVTLKREDFSEVLYRQTAFESLQCISFLRAPPYVQNF